MIRRDHQTALRSQQDLSIGKDNFTVDREVHEDVMKVFPLGSVMVRENREFMARAVGYVAGHGVAQFIEICTRAAVGTCDLGLEPGGTREQATGSQLLSREECQCRLALTRAASSSPLLPAASCS